ncbi:MAG: glycerol-3-phosphate dehydrogenase subunit GlpB [Desulfotignum sp.]
MNQPPMADTVIHTHLAVIGSGMAGMAAAIFARNRGMATVQVGRASEIGFASGCLDLFSTLPGHPSRVYADPFEGIAALKRIRPDHPYSHVTRDQIRKAFREFTRFMASAGIRFHGPSQGINQQIITPAGTLKPTWQVPGSMIAGAGAVAEKQRIGLVDIQGLKGFGARQMAQTLKSKLPGITGATIAFPGRETAGNLMCEHLCWDLETPAVMERFIQRLRPHADPVDVLGLPAVLGIYRFEARRHTLEQALGRPVFEIPTLSPSVTGMRMKEAFLEKAPGTGHHHFPVAVSGITRDRNGFVFFVTRGQETVEIRARFLILATGRFLGQGLGVKSDRITEMLFGLPVTQPADRSRWLRRDFFDQKGHPVNRAGLETDCFFRPLDDKGSVFHPRLYAAGSIIAHQDWKREKSGSGIAIASAFRAVSHMASGTTPPEEIPPDRTTAV